MIVIIRIQGRITFVIDGFSYYCFSLLGVFCWNTGNDNLGKIIIVEINEFVVCKIRNFVRMIVGIKRTDSFGVVKVIIAEEQYS